LRTGRLKINADTRWHQAPAIGCTMGIFNRLPAAHQPGGTTPNGCHQPTSGCLRSGIAHTRHSPQPPRPKRFKSFNERFFMHLLYTQNNIKIFYFHLTCY
jgi:hypothetical protein